LPRPFEMDPGLAWIESARAIDPDLTITMALIKRIREEA
jgi:hypothetical protein